MIRPLRQYHRRLVIALGFVLPVAFAAGIATRKPVPILSELPSNLTLSSESFETVAGEGARLFAKTTTEVHFLRERAPSSRLAISFSGTEAFVKPDMLVYWAAGNPSIAGTLPPKAILLGGFDSNVLLLPPETATKEGVLVLYSLADNEIVDVSRPARFARPQR